LARLDIHDVAIRKEAAHIPSVFDDLGKIAPSVDPETFHFSIGWHGTAHDGETPNDRNLSDGGVPRWRRGIGVFGGRASTKRRGGTERSDIANRGSPEGTARRRRAIVRAGRWVRRA